ncbi:MAG TPA: GntR family transcriptional regulator [Gemmataceae bacterium]|jgi:GntR family transcriptional regulator
MNLELDPELTLDGSGPIHQQIVRQLSRLIRSGALAPGEELPSVRAMAVGLAINPEAVEAAFAELETSGYVTRREGTGVLVAPRGAWRSREKSELEELCADFLRQVSCSGFSADEVLQTLHALVEKRMP